MDLFPDLPFNLAGEVVRDARPPVKEAPAPTLFPLEFSAPPTKHDKLTEISATLSTLNAQ